MTSQAAAALVTGVREGGRAPADARNLEPLLPLVGELRRRLSLGPGFAVVEGFPLDALDAVDAVLATPGIALDHRLERGELQLLDNFATWHARAAFRDGDARRLLLRLWLATPQSPELPEPFGPLYGATDAGSVRGGVWPVDGYPSHFGHRVQPLL